MPDTKQTRAAYDAYAAQGTLAWQAFQKEAERPMEVTTELLMKLMEDNKDTEYGKKYDFAHIKSIEDYQKKVPVVTYENLAEYLGRMLEGERNILTAYPYDHMNETSGTVGAPKVVPMTDKQSAVFAKYNNMLTYGLMNENMPEDWKNGRAFCTSSGNCRKLPSGITVGEASAKMADYVKGGADALDAMIRTMYTSPLEGLNPVPGSDIKYIHTRFALADKEVRGLVTGFYSVAVLYLQYIANNYDLLIDDIEKGTIDPSLNISEEVRATLMTKIEPMPERAAELREIFKNGSDFPFVPKIWPHFCYLFGVGGDGFKIYDDTIKANFTGEGIANVYSGITASEGLWSVPFEINRLDSVLAPGASFMEFLPVEAGDDFTQCVTMDKLEVGKVYELIITNLAGFYRYRMSDAVRVTGKYKNTPTVEFMYRVNRTINLAEEKTTEKALQAAVEAAAKEMNFPLSDFSVYPDTNVTPNNYVFLIEPRVEQPDMDKNALRECVFKHLCEANPVYYECYEDNWLGKPEVHWLEPETSLLYRDIMYMKGASLNQLKPVRVIMNENQRDFFFSLAEL